MLNVTQDSTCMYKYLLRLAAIEDALFGVTPGTQVHAEVPRTGQQSHGDMQVITCSCAKRIETAFPLTNKHVHLHDMYMYIYIVHVRSYVHQYT